MPAAQVTGTIQSVFARLEFGALLDALIAQIPRGRRILRPLLYSGCAAYLLSGVYALQPDETGVVERFGRKVLPYRESGLHYKLPWPIDRLTLSRLGAET